MTVDYATAAATATAGRDYAEASGTLTFAPGDIKKTITVALLDDDVHEGSETFSVSLSGAEGATLEDGTGTGTILDNDEAFVTIRGSQGPENGHLDFVVMLSTSSEATVSMDYLTDAGITAYPAPAFELAEAGSDFVHKEGTLTFAPGETSKTIRVSLLADTLSEAAEAVVVTMGNPVNVAFELRGGSDECPWGGCDASACCDCGIILDGAQDPTLAVADAEIAEDGGTLTFSATLSAESASDVTVSYATSDGTAVAGDDYEAASGMLTFAAGETEHEIEVAVLDDIVEEPDESLTLTLSDPVNAALGDAVAKGTILDDDEASTAITLAADPPRATEDGGPAEVTVTATLDAGARTEATTVTVAVAGSGVADAVDFDPVAGFAITIGSGETSGTGTFTLTPENDLVDESDETLSIDGTSDLPVTGTTVALVDDDKASTAIALAADPPRATEDGGPAEVTVTATLDAGARTEATTVTVAVSGSGVADAVDFDPVAGFAIMIGSGKTSGTGTFTLTPENDLVDESDETLSIDGTSDLPVTGTTVALVDDDEASTVIALAADPPRATEDGGPAEVTVTATLDAGARTEATTVTVAVAGSGVADAVDFDPVAGFAIMIGSGKTSGTGTFTLTPENDLVDERDETLSIDGTSDLPVTGTTVALVDDDEASAAITLAADPPRATEDGGPAEVTVTATLDAGARTEATTVTVAVAGSGVADAVDFDPVAGFAITIGSGETSGTGTFTLTPENDLVDESDETLSIDGTSDLPVTGTTVALVDDDKASTAIALAADPPRATEDGGPAEVTVTATLDAGARTEATTVTVAVSGSGVADAVDFDPVAGFAIMIGSGKTSGTGTFTLTPENDLVDESDETLSIDGTSDLPVTGTTVALVDDDEASTVIALAADPPRATEDGGPAEVTVTATLDAGARTEATTVTVAVAGSGVADAVDFDPVAGFAIMIGSGKTSGTGTFTLTPENDLVDERDETLSIDGTSDLPVTGTTVALVDDDEASAAIALAADPPRATEDGGPAEVTVTATLDAGARTEATTVTVTVSGSGVADAVDFDPVAGFAITIGSGKTSGTGTFTLTPENDLVDESDETLSIDGTSDLPVTGTTVALVDDDEASTAIALAADPPRATEDGGPAEVTVTATLDAGARTEATTVTVTVTGSGNADAVDFAAVRDFTIMIAAGDRSGTGTFTLAPEDDNVDESDETLTVDGSSDLSVTGDTITLADDDQPSGEILLSASPTRIPEDGGAKAVEVTATLDASARTVPTTVSVSVADSGQPDAVDYVASETAFDVTIAAGTTSVTKIFMVTPEDDEVDERDEVLDIAGTSELPVTPTSVTLTDDDQTSTEILLSAVPSTVSEGAGATSVEVTATLDAGARTEETTVTVTVMGGGDPDSVDFTAVRDFMIMIAEGATIGRGTFSLTPENDNLAERSETLTVDGTADVPVTGTSVTITDDDVASDGIVLSASPARVSEDGGAVPVKVTASLNGAARQAATTVSVSVAASGDPGAVDFQAVADFAITIAANAANGTGTFTLTPEDDGAAEADETLTVSGASDLPVTSIMVTLADDDDASTRILLLAVPERVSEGDGATPVTVTATLDRALRQQATTVAVTVSGSGDPDAADFAAVPDFSITIPANAASGTGTFTLTSEDDATVEANERLTVSGTSDLPVTPAAVTLVDNDEVSTRILLSAVPGRILEDQGPTTVAVTATLNKSPRRQPTTVTVSVAGSGDPHAVDFDPVADFAITIPANAASVTRTFTLTPENDRSVEPNETLSVDGTSDLPVTGTTVELVDDDAASTRIVLSVVPSRMSEGAGPTPVAVTASLDRGLRQTATAVTISVAGSGDPNAVDFEPVPDLRIMIGANRASSTGTFTLTPEDDRNVETDEMLTVSGASDLPVSQATMVLADDDEVSTRILLFLSVNPAQASEGGGPVEVTVTAALDRGVRSETTRIAVSVAGSGDPFAVDFAPITGVEIVIPANAPSGTGTFTVVPEDDAIVERDEVLTVSGASDLPVTPTTLSLLDDDEVKAILLSAAPAGVREDGGPVAVTVTASLDRGLRQEATTVTVSVSGSGNPHAVDFAAVPDFTITIAANAASGTGTFALRPEDDAENEADETLTVSGVSDLPVRPATIELLDDDEMASRVLSIADAEAAESAGDMAFAVTLDGPSAAEVTVGYATADPAGSVDPVATADVDYDSVSGTLMFAPGEVSKTIRVSVLDDSLDESDETFALVLSDPRGATLGRGSALGTIRDDDEMISRVLSIADAEAAEGAGEVRFAVTLDGPSPAEVTVSYATADPAGSVDPVAGAGIDYESASGTLTFAPGEVSRTIAVSVIDDSLDEPDETFTLVLADPRGATVGRGSALGTIRDDDEMTSRVLSIADAEAAEGAGEVRFAVTLDGPSPAEVTVSYATADPAGSVDPVAGAGVDYESASGTLTFAPGEVSRTIAVSVIDDSLDEPDETFTLVLADPRGATVGRGSALGTIRDDDEMTSRVLSIADAEAVEGAGEVSFVVTLDGPSAAEVTVGYATADPAGSVDPVAGAGIDYESASGMLTFAPGEVSQTIRVQVLDDELDELDETFALVLSDLQGATLGRGSALGTIRDDDEPPALSIAGDTGPEDVGELVFSVTLMARAPTEVTVNYATMDDTAIAGDDYGPVEGTLTFAPGETARTIRVAVVDDAVDEADEEIFAVTLSGPSGATLAHALATGVIRDDDEPPALSVADASGRGKADGTATAGGD